VVLCLAVLAAGCADDEPETVTTSAASAATASAASTTVGTNAETTEPGTTEPSTTGTTAGPSTTSPIALVGTTFVSTAITGFEPPAGTQIALAFEADRLSASGGCNQLTSNWALEGDVLVVGDIASTQVACEPAALMDLDTWLSSLLTSDPTVVVEGDTLTLTEGQSAITLTAAS
jgi:heat shock protein HslJ